jgi:predicted HicB family RNase H-like nuclease
MDEGQKKKHIGRGMKPRGNKPLKHRNGRKPMVDQSTTEGQPESVKEPVLEAQEVNETPGNLELENEAPAVQNLDSEEATVAHDADLEAALNESEDVVDAEWPTECSHGKPLNDDCEKCEASALVEDKKFNIAVFHEAYESIKFPTSPDGRVIGVDHGSGEDKTMIAVIKRGDDNLPDELLATMGAVSIGPQPDGSEKFIVTVQEGYTDAVRQWAEADGVDVNRWLSDRLYEYISTYGEPAQSR